MRWVLLTGALLITAAASWWLLQVTMLEAAERSNASGYGQFVLAVIGILIIVASAVKKAFTPGAPPSIDSLAMVMRDQWEKAARDRRLLEPAPLPIRWRRSTLPVAVPVAAATSTRGGRARFDPLPGLSPTTSVRLREGNRSHLHSVYGGLASGRLVIAGPAGSGKSAAAILLLLDALRHREQASSEDRARIPVPVMFTLHGWDPVATPVRDWLLHKLSELPLFRKAGAEGLLDAGRIAVFLDGLDEINEDLRPIALQALSEQATFRLVLLTRRAELVDAAQHNPLLGAAAIELQPVTPADAADYLLSPLVSPAPTGWQAIADALCRNVDSPLTSALNNPLTLTLLRDVGPANQLLDTDRFPTSDDIENHLLDHALIAAYSARPGQLPPRYSLQTAQETLGYIADRLNQDGSRDLAWWTIPQWTTRALRANATGLIVGLMIGLVYGLSLLLLGAWPGFIGGIVIGLVTGYIVGVALGSTEAVPKRIRKSWWHGPFRGRGLSSALPIGVGVALLGGLAGTMLGKGAGFPAWLAYGVVLWLGAGIGMGLGAPSIRSAGPLDSWRQDLAASFAIAAIIGLATLGGGLAVSPVERGPLIGLVMGGAGWVSALTLSAAWRTVFAQVRLAMSVGVPVRLMRFLEDAQSRHVLRTVGPVYQFRHAKLQDRLALLSSER